ncbi:MAG: YvcK family protein [Acidimicrobiia bacterium]|nr:YvcK family protein [Acidimicrobiia bacterium]
MTAAATTTADKVSGPRVVALGGGHGLAATLSAVRRYAASVTAVVSVADDGGSSGRLRQAFPIPAPGDLRRCLVALGDPDSPWAGFFEHRFDAGELEGHPLGNLVIAGLTGALGGNFVAAVEEAGRLVGCTGQVLPATTTPVVLKGAADGHDVEGQVNVSSAIHLSTVSLVPPDAPAPAAAVAAIVDADQVVLGPGSLFTSVLAAAIVPGIRHALATTTATKVYVCNLAPQLPETEGLDVAAHVAALAAHEVHPDVVLCQRGGLLQGECGVLVVEDEVAAPGAAAHDPVRLGRALARLAERRGGGGQA